MEDILNLNGIEEALMIDDDLFFNFTEDASEGSSFKNGISDSSSSLELSNEKTTAFGPETRNDFFPEPTEDLEWLIDKNSFPTVESCFGLLFNDSHLSPISVLDTIKTNENSNSNLKVPTNHPKGSRSSKRRRRMVGYGDLPSQHCLWSSDLDVPIEHEPVLLGRRCQHCLVDKTPQWRTGPMGPKTLCNACGVRYKSGRLHPEYRPACSPTFSSLLHSNSHKKVVEMRMKKQDGVW